MPYLHTQIHLPDLIPLEPTEPKVIPPRDEDELLQELRDRRLEDDYRRHDSLNER